MVGDPTTSKGARGRSRTCGLRLRTCEPAEITRRPPESRSVSFHGLTKSRQSTNVPGNPANHESFCCQVLPRFVSPQEAADRLGICRETIYRLCKKGRIPCLRVAQRCVWI